MNPRHRQLPGSLSRRGPPRHAELARPARAAPSWPASLATPLAAIDALPPALAWLLGLLVAIAVVIVVHWQHPHTLWLALALPWLAVYLTRGAGVRPTGPARELRGRLVAIVAIAAIGTSVTSNTRTT